MLQPLKDILRQPDTILFIGSGISRWSGLPTWPGMLEELACYLEAQSLDATLVRRETQNGDLLLAASYGFEMLTAPLQKEFISSACRLGTATPDLIHQKLVTLGPACFVTTNYDRLLEQSFTRWPLDAPIDIVLNTQLSKQPTIMQARATHFLYKLHGDLAELASIILTREHYRRLDLHGDLHAAQRTIETLMLTRPFIYFGFGLRDPDFLYVKGILANLYQRNATKSYAVLANISPEEKDYFARNLGIHLISYPVETVDGKPSHTGLLTLLDQLGTGRTPSPAGSFEEHFQLRLLRYAARLKNVEPSGAHIPLLASVNLDTVPPTPVEPLLDENTGSFILLGSSGAGKTYAMRNSAARLADDLNNAIIQETYHADQTPIPLFADLKLYQGDLVRLLEENLPSGWQLDDILRRFKLRIYLDAFNELPHRHQQHWETDFSRLLKTLGTATVVITSRSAAGLENFGLPGYYLDRIDRKFIDQDLAAAGLKLKGPFAMELTATLQIPFFYKLFKTYPGSIEADTGPHKLYETLLSTLDSRFKEHIGDKDLSILPALSQVATEAFNSGQEAFPVGIFERHLLALFRPADPQSPVVGTIIQWLISQEFLIPLPGQRISFLHQSVTEYLVAIQLAADFKKDPGILKQKFRDKYWDNVILLTLSILPRKQAERFITAILRIDFEFALSAAKYLQGENKDLLTAMLIRTAAARDQFSAWLINWNLPVNRTHIPLIRELISRGGKLGAEALALLVGLEGAAVKEEVFQLLLDKCLDSEFIKQLGQSLSGLVLDPDDLSRMRMLADKVPYSSLKREFRGTAFSHAVGLAIMKFDPGLVEPLFYDPHSPVQKPGACRDILFFYLTHSHYEYAIKMAAKMLLANDHKVLEVLDSIFTYTTQNRVLDLSPFTGEHCIILTTLLPSADVHMSGSIMVTLKTICAHRPDLHSYIREETEKTTGIVRVALFYCLDRQSIFEPLEQLLAMDDRKLKKEHLYLAIRLVDVNWQGHEPLLLRLLQRRSFDLGGTICFGICFSRAKYPLSMDIGPIYWWLQWFKDIRKPSWVENGSYLDCISSVVADSMSSDKRAEFIDEFNNPDSPYRRILVQTIIDDLDDLDIDELSEETISFILDKKNGPDYDYMYRILYRIADEEFVTTRLLPLYKSATGQFRKALHSTLTYLGQEHGIRYL